MPRLTHATLPHRHALNEVLLYTSRAPAKTLHRPALFIRALRSRLQMSQADLAKCAKMTQAPVARVESGADARLSTLRRLFGAMFCDLVVLPKQRRPSGDAIAERRLEHPTGNPWA